ncbi:MAG: four helix bundle protein [Bacteroidales bacterium]|nr:four helix bundle protein [Bacteroidales bacterium]
MATGLENLWIYKLAEDLEIEVHEITKRFPKDEIFRSVDQLRRSSSSVSNNIAESYHKTTLKEKTRYLNISKGEAEETKRGILKSARKKFLSEDVAIKIADRYTIILKGTNAYIRFLNLNELQNNNHKNK